MAGAAMKMGPKAATAAHELDLSMLPEKRDYRRIDAFAREFLRVPKGTGAGEPFRLRPWQRAVVKRLYPPTGKRPRQGVLSLPRGNGKSGLAAALALYGLLADGVEGAQVAVVASDERQARIVFNAARRMIELDERLREQVQVFTDRLYVRYRFDRALIDRWTDVDRQVAQIVEQAAHAKNSRASVSARARMSISSFVV